MEKRLLLAVALSLGLMMAWTGMQKKLQPIDNIDIADHAESTQRAVPSPASADLPLGETWTGDTFIVQRGPLEIEFIETLGAIKSLTFHNYKDYEYEVSACSNPDVQSPFRRILADDRSGVHFQSDSDGQRIIKSYIFGKTMYDMELRVAVRNLSSYTLNITPGIIAGVMHFSQTAADNQYVSASFSAQGKIVHYAGRKPVERTDAEFIALRDRYFCFVVDPDETVATSKIIPLQGGQSAVEIRWPVRSLEQGQETSFSSKIYGGPQDIEMLNSVNAGWTSIVHYGPFDIISHLLLQILGFFYRVVHNWGWSIILLSLTTYLILFPLSIKQMRSMREMQKLQPHIEEMRVLYKDNPQKMNREIMELYRTHKVNPLSGCLPIVLQMPIFFALYPVLMRSAFLRGADFLWIKDLSSPDRIATMPLELPFLKNELNLLPVVLALLMFVQQRLTLKSSPKSAQADQQKIMMVIMPVMFGFIFYHMPAGLVLYWLVNSILMLVFQLRLGRST